MAFIAFCFRWPSYRSTTSSTIITSTAIHNHYLAYIPTHYLHRNIQQHIRMYANNITVCCIHLTKLSPFSLSFIPYRRSAPSSWSALSLTILHRWWCSRSQLVMIDPADLVSKSVKLQYVWQITMCDKYVCYRHTTVFVQIFSELSVCMCVLPF